MGLTPVRRFPYYGRMTPTHRPFYLQLDLISILRSNLKLIKRTGVLRTYREVVVMLA